MGYLGKIPACDDRARTQGVIPVRVQLDPSLGEPAEAAQGPLLAFMAPSGSWIGPTLLI